MMTGVFAEMRRKSLRALVPLADKMFIAGFAAACVVGCSLVYGFHLNGPPIRSDGLGYYVYYPAIMIYGDITMARLVVDILGEHAGHHGLRPYGDDGAYLNKYPVGVGLLGTPFYLVAHGTIELLGLSNSPMHWHYQVANMASAIFWFCCGTACLLKLLRAHFSQAVSWAVLLICVYGTSVFHYTTYDASFSHVYSYAFVCFLLWLLYGATCSTSLRRHALVGLILGVLTIIRPTNAVFALFYVERLFADRCAEHATAPLPARLIVSGLAASLPICIQLGYWYAVTGNPVVWSYGDAEGFNFAAPELSNFLFSVRKGLFFWAPVLAVCLLGFFVLVRRHTGYTVAGIAVIAILTYVCASWHHWPFGGSFGTRVFVEVVPVLALPLAALIATDFGRVANIFLRTGLIAGTVWTMVMMAGYWRNIVPFDHATPDDVIDALRQVVPFI
jgi:hypothetical protein